MANHERLHKLNNVVPQWFTPEHPYLSEPLSEQRLLELADNERDFLLLHGGCFRSMDSAHDDQVRFASFFMFPSLFPRKAFDKARHVQPVMNKLYARVAADREFLTDTLKATIEVDDFTASLFRIYAEVSQQKNRQCVSLAVMRSDYFYDTHCSDIRQVEVNTIAVSFAALARTINQCHRYVLGQLGCEDKMDRIPENESLQGIAEGMLCAYDHYGVPGSALLFVVEDRCANLCDQRFHEFAVCRLRPGVRVLRRSHTQLITSARLDHLNQLFVDDVQVAVIYYRTGYTPRDYPTQAHWDVRLLLERSSSIKCPSIQLHLAGTKKVQQVLTRPGVLERFLDSPEEVSQCRSVFANLYSLDMTSDGDAAVQMALRSPERFVLKPQREGGGNNVYGREVASVLSQVGEDAGRCGFVLMDRLWPLVQRNYLLRPPSLGQVEENGGHRQTPFPVDSVTELGIFGYVLCNGSQIMENKCCGFTLRSKPEDVQEGGIAAGLGAMDSPFLV